MTRVWRKKGSWAARLAFAWLLAAIQATAQAQAQEGRIGAQAMRDRVADFAIAAGPAAQSIPEFARQAHLTVLAATDDLAGVQTKEVQGRLSADEALARLLAGTPLAPHVKDNGSVLIAAARAGTAAAADGGAILRFGSELRFDHTPSQAELDAIGADLPRVVVSARLSQQSAIERKKMAATAMDSIVADDVGTLPDRNIGEAISRIAGVAIGRDDFGEGVNVSIRGNAPELTGVELDGQSVRSAGGSDMNGDGDGRATEFRQLSSDLIKSVDVVKGATADMTEGSLGGAIIIKTRSALEFDKPFVSIRAAGTQNSLNRRWDPDTNLIATRKFLHDRLGVLVNLSATTHTNESHQFQTAANSQDGAMRELDFDNSPQKTFTYHPETVDLGQAAATTPWASYGSWNAATPLEIVTKSAAAQTKQDCYAAFPVLGSDAAVLSGLSSSRKIYAINAQNRELASCLNQWNDYSPALLRYFVKRQVDERKNLDLRTDFRVDRHLTVYAKGSFSRRSVDDNYLAYSLGNISINGDASRFTDVAGVRAALPGSGYSTFPYAYSLASGAAPLQGAVANIDPASVVVDANHHVTRYTLQNAGVSTDQIRNHMGTNTGYLQLGGHYRAGPLRIEFLAGDMRSRFWRADMRTAWGYAYGDATVALQPDGIWAYSLPPGVNLNDWTQVAALRPAASATAAQYTAVSPQIAYSPQLRETGERTARIDLSYALGGHVPFLRRLKSGFNLRDTSSDAWGSGGYTVSPALGTPGAAGYVPAITVPGDNLRSSFVGCQDTPGSLGAGGTPCAYGLNPAPGSRNYQIVLTPQQFQEAILGSMSGPATATRLFNGAKNRPDALIDNWTQIDVARLFATIGAPNLNYDCMKTCTGSDGKTYEQPKTRIRERTEAGYLMADFSLGHLPFTEHALPFGWKLEGNVGARYVRTRESGTGIMTFVSKTRTALFDPANPGAAAGYTTSQVTRNVTIDAITHDFLPSYNLAMWLVPDQLVLRYNHARTVARPGASKLIPSGTCIYDETRLDVDGNPIEPMSCTTTVGNPALRAQANVNQNLSAEWYPNKDTLFSASVYRQVGKVGAPVVDGVDGARLFADSGLVDPATGASLAGIPYAFKTWLNGQPATRTGVELSAKTALTFLPSYLRFTGVDANVTRQHSNQARIAWDLLSGDVLPPPGEARYSFNWALWYDDGRWQARVAVQTVGAKFNCISPCGGSTAGYSLNAYPNASLGWKYPAYNPGTPYYNDRTSYVDGKISYRVNKALDVFIEGRNLTNQIQSTSLASAPYADGTPNLQNYYYAGRRITFGLNYRMR